MSELQVVEANDVLVPLGVQDAERLDRRIRLMAQTTRDNFEKVGRLLDEAKQGNVHEVLGFKSWTAYIADAVGGQLQLSGETRQAMVQMLAGEGMSVRAIATATGVSKSTVDRDLAQVSHDGTPAAETGVPQRDTSEPTTITTLDGKTFTKKPRKPRKPKPEPEPEPESTRKVQLPTAFRSLEDLLAATVFGMDELTHDPRWSKATARFNEKDRSTLDAHIVALQAIRAAMGEPAEVAS